MTRIATRIAFAAMAIVMGIAAPASAAELTLRWLTEDGSVAAEQALDLPGVDALPQREIVTSTPWTKGPSSFTGPSFAELARLVDQPAATARVTALNDYVAEIPAADWAEFGIILAARRDGETMAIRDKGPYWVIYPLDSSPSLDAQIYDSRMVWQVRSIDFLAR